MSETVGYIIMSINKANEKLYMAIDYDSGGYPYWYPSFKGSYVFSHYEEALFYLKNTSCFTKYSITKNDKYKNYEFPPRMIQCGAKTNLDNPTGSLNIYIMKIELESVYSTMFNANITEVKNV